LLSPSVIDKDLAENSSKIINLQKKVAIQNFEINNQIEEMGLIFNMKIKNPSDFDSEMLKIENAISNIQKIDKDILEKKINFDKNSIDKLVIECGILGIKIDPKYFDLTIINQEIEKLNVKLKEITEKQKKIKLNLIEIEYDTKLVKDEQDYITIRIILSSISRIVGSFLIGLGFTLWFLFYQSQSDLKTLKKFKRLSAIKKIKTSKSGS
jgi:hypothetical protein